MAKKTELATIDDAKFEALDTLIEKSNLVHVAGLGKMKQAFQLAIGMTSLRDAITPEIMEPIMRLQGTPVGFDTDLSKTTDNDGNPVGYSMEVVKDCVIQALMVGVQLINNQFNIISGRAYITKNGMQYLVGKLGLKEYRYTIAEPGEAIDKKALVQGKASWVDEDGVKQEIDRDFVVRVNKGMMAEATMGKANRKLHAAVLEMVTQYRAADGDTTDALPPKRVESKVTDALPVEYDEETGQELPPDNMLPMG